MTQPLSRVSCHRDITDTAANRVHRPRHALRDCAPLPHRLRQHVEHRLRLRPAQARIRDRHAVLQRHARLQVQARPRDGSRPSRRRSAARPATTAARDPARPRSAARATCSSSRASNRPSPARATRPCAAPRSSPRHARRRSSPFLPPRRITCASSLPRVSKIAAIPIFVIPMNAWLAAAATIASDATCTPPSVPFLKPIGQLRPEASWRWLWLPVADRAPRDQVGDVLLVPAGRGIPVDAGRPSALMSSSSRAARSPSLMRRRRADR